MKSKQWEDAVRRSLTEEWQLGGPQEPWLWSRKLPTDKAQASLNAPLWTLIWPILRPWTLYSFLRAAITKYHKLCGLKQQVFSLTVWKLEVWNWGIEAGPYSLKELVEDPSLCVLASGGGQHPWCVLAYGHIPQFLPLSSHVTMWLLLCDYVFLSIFPSPYKDTNILD